MRALVLFLLLYPGVSTGLAQRAFCQVTVVLPGESWSIDDKPITGSTRIPVNGPIIGSVEGSSDLLLECQNKEWIAYTCKKLPCRVYACGQVISTDHVAATKVSPIIRNEGAPTAGSGGLFASLFKRQPAALAVLGVRDGGRPNDAAVRKRGNELHLGPALNRVLEGRYCFRFTPLSPEMTSPQTAALDWDRSNDKEGILQAPNLKTGLYTLEMSPPEAMGACTFQEEKTPAWLLISSDADFARIEPAWKDYSSQIREYESSGVSPTVLVTVRHAVLARLAESEGK